MTLDWTVQDLPSPEEVGETLPEEVGETPRPRDEFGVTGFDNCCVLGNLDGCFEQEVFSLLLERKKLESHIF